MKPETVAKLLDNIPEVKELIAFLASEADKLDKLSVLDKTHVEDLPAHIVGLKYARDTINTMLAPLLGAVDKPIGADPKEFIV